MRFTILAIGTLLVCGALAAALLPEFASRGFASPDAALFSIALFTLLIGGALLGFRDTYAFAWLLASLGAFGTASFALTLAVGAPVSREAAGFLACSLLVLFGGTAYIARTRFRRDPVPDVLSNEFGRNAIYEVNDVQLTAACPHVVPVNVIAPIEVYLQNCVDAPRIVTVGLDDEPLFGSGGAIAWRRPEPVHLEPSEVKILQIPFCSARAGTFLRSTYLCVRATGPRGNRVRHRRAPYAARPLKSWQVAMIVILASPLFWVIVWGRGGLKLTVRFSSAVPLRHPSELPEPIARTLWPEPT